MTHRDDNLQQYATERQWELLCSMWEHGSARKAAKELGLSKDLVARAHRAVLRRASRSGYSPEHDLTHTVPDGYKIRGTSTMYREGKPILQWVKSTEDHERQEELLQALIEGSKEDLGRVEPTAYQGNSGGRGKMAVYPVSDAHFGMYAWHEEAGGNYDLGIAESLFTQSIERLSSSLAPADDATLVVLGDFLHYDSMESVTPAHKNILDSDSRFQEVVRTAIRCLRRAVEMLLERHLRVRLIIQAGNHDESTTRVFAESFAAMYEDDFRLTVDTNPCVFHYFRHGSSLVGVCHGHEAKRLQDLPLIMAVDRPDDWGATKHRYWLTGHVHHDRAVEVQGVRVESFRIMAPADAYAHGKGYRAGRDMKGLLLDERHGEVTRVVVNPDMFVV